MEVNNTLRKVATAVDRCLRPEKHIERMFEEAIEKVREENQQTEERFPHHGRGAH